MAGTTIDHFELAMVQISVLYLFINKDEEAIILF
jgi:hypothetical protein